MTPMHLHNWERHYQPANRLAWRGRVDYADKPTRFHEVSECVDLREEPELTIGSDLCYGLIGFACDEGIRRNLGRVGAAKGPEAFRQALANAPIGARPLRLLDFGSIGCWDENLEAAQEALAYVVNYILSHGIRPIVVGGGHETAWGHYMGLHQANPGAKIGVVNFDAHFDLRPLSEEGLGSSGTSFLQIAQLCEKENQPFDYTVIGLQPVSNTDQLFQEAQQMGTRIVTADELTTNQMDRAFEIIDQAVERSDGIYCTLCLDVFSSCTAPGVSAPQPFGLNSWHILPILKHLAKSGKVIGVDVCELSPPFDRDGRTAALAAALIATFVHNSP